MRDIHLPTTAVIPAAGNSTRMGNGKSKQFILLQNVPVLVRTLLAFERSKEVDDVIVVTREQDIADVQKMLDEYKIEKVRLVIKGGSTRQESVYRGLCEITHHGLVLIHDGARPFIRPEQIDAIARELYNSEAVALGVAVKDTIKKVKNECITETVPRNDLYAIQTPQGFRFDTVFEAYLNADITATDDCALAEAFGVTVHVMPGSELNIKITTKEDLILAEGILFAEQKKEGL